MLPHYLVKCKRSKMTNCAEITINHVKVPHVFSYLSLQNLLKVSLFKLPTSSQMCMPLVNCQESSLSFSSKALSHTQPTSLPGLLSPDQTALTSTQWTTLSVSSPNSMSTSPVCSRCQWTFQESFVIPLKCIKKYCLKTDVGLVC